MSRIFLNVSDSFRDDVVSGQPCNEAHRYEPMRVPAVRANAFVSRLVRVCWLYMEQQRLCKHSDPTMAPLQGVPLDPR